MANQVYLVDHTAKEFLPVFLSDDAEKEGLAACANTQEALNFLWHRSANRLTVEYHATSQLDLWNGEWKEVD